MMRLLTLLLFIFLISISNVYATQQNPLPYSELPQELQDNFQILVASAEKGEVLLIDRELSILREYKDKGFFNNIIPLSAQAGFSLYTSHSLTPDQKANFLNRVIELSPDYPENYFYLASAYIQQHNIGLAIQTYIMGFQKIVAYPQLFLIKISNFLLYLLKGLVWAFLIFSMGIFIRYVPLLSHDLADLIPGIKHNVLSTHDPNVYYSWMSAHTSKIGILLAMALMFAPIAAGFGLYPAAFLWILFVGIYMKRKVLVWVVIGMLITAMVPFAGIFVNTATTINDSLEAALYDCGNDMCTTKEQTRLEKYLKDHKADQYARYAFALSILHEIPESRTPLTILHTARNIAKDINLNGVRMGLMGNIYLIEAFLTCNDKHKPSTDYLNRAEQFFKKGLNYETSIRASLIGLILISRYKADIEGMERYYRQLVDMAREDEIGNLVHLRDFIMEQNFCANIAGLYKIKRNPGVDWSGIFFNRMNWNTSHIVLPSVSLMFRGLNKTLTLFWGVISIILLLLINFLAKGVSTARECPKCHTISCSSCNIKLTGFDYCPVCLLSQIRGAIIGAGESFIERAAMDKKRRRNNILKLILALVIPGSGQTIDGKEGLGLFLLIFLFTIFAWTVYPWPMLLDPRTYVGYESVAQPWLPPVGLIVIYAISWIEAWKRYTQQ